jgi:serine/threonine protein kinase
MQPEAERPQRGKPDAEDPRQIGDFVITERIGWGRACTVYWAEQREPVYRTVVIKSLRGGLDRPYVLEQFQAERQALATMRHDNIPKLLEAGTAADGCPYFVMEASPGIPIDAYCDQHRLTITQRLALVAEVCFGVHHAHANGIIHRDLQSKNILVSAEDARPVPLIIDWSLAQAAGQGFADVNASVVDTPLHISPELVLGRHQTDARADVYALGAVLYDLVAGSEPFKAETSKEGLPGVGARAVATTLPARPSDCVRESADGGAAVARARGVKPSQLIRALRGDVDFIVTKAMQPNRADRYQTCLELAEDLQRHLRHEPVGSGSTTLSGVRVQKAIKRNRPFVIGAVTAVVLFASGLLIWGGGPERTIAVDRGGFASGFAVPPSTGGGSEAYAADYTRSHALLIGTSYARQGTGGFGRLPNAEADIAAMQARLGSLSRKWEVTPLVGEKATRKGILDALGRLREEAAPNDRILIYFAGHGDRLEDTDHSAWIIPDDAQPRSKDAGRATWIRFDEFLNFFDEVKAKHVMLALDCCYSGRIVPMRSGGATEYHEKYLTRRARLVVASGRANDQVPDGKAGSNSPFTEAFLSALAPGNTEALTGTALFAHIQAALQNSAQTPGMTYIRSARGGAAEGEFIFFPE